MAGSLGGCSERSNSLTMRGVSAILPLARVTWAPRCARTGLESEAFPHKLEGQRGLETALSSNGAWSRVCREGGCCKQFLKVQPGCKTGGYIAPPFELSFAIQVVS